MSHFAPVLVPSRNGGRGGAPKPTSATIYGKTDFARGHTDVNVPAMSSSRLIHTNGRAQAPTTASRTLSGALPTVMTGMPAIGRAGVGLTVTEGWSIAPQVRTSHPSTEGETRDPESDPELFRSQARLT